MKFQYCSDLHLEFNQNSDYLKKYPLLPHADILLLAGDITYLRHDFFEHPFFDYISQNWEIIYWIPGNHEYYCGIDMLAFNLDKPVEIRKNVLLINNGSINYKDYQLIFSTLWSTIDVRYKRMIESQVSDFDCIVYNNKKLDSERFNQLHQKSFNFLKNAINQNSSRKNIIITHHLPSHQCNHLSYTGSKINSAFVSNLDEFVEKCNALVWIYGHSHRNMPETIIGNTRLLTNQLGYVHLGEHNYFNRAQTFEIK
jgi:predicted phosphohydrolase